MSIKSFAKNCSLLFLIVSVYLSMVAAWAWSSFDAIAGEIPIGGMPLSTRQVEILLKVEDPTFFQHPGISLAKGQGFATISSALARDLYLSGPRLSGISGSMQTFYRAVFNCCKKIDLGRDIMALVVNAKLSKDRQLALYVQTVYMGTNHGEQVRGIEKAAFSYLGKPLEQATEREFIGLVAMIKAPNEYSPVRNPAAHELRTARIEALLSGRCVPSGWFDTSFNQCNKLSSTDDR
jgi:membrane carboxypeptidase/penicillin-binding protein